MAVPRGTTRPGSILLLAAFVAASLFPLRCESRCRGCDAFASYYITQGQNLTYISSLFGIVALADIDSRVLPPNNLTSKDSIQADTRVNIPFSCSCMEGGSLGQTFTYLTQRGDNYGSIAREVYKNLTTDSSLQNVNSYTATRIPDNVSINVTVTCFCGDADVSRDYGLFSTYPLSSGETLRSVANASGFNESLLRSYNPAATSSVGEIIYVPTRGEACEFLSFVLVHPALFSIN